MSYTFGGEIERNTVKISRINYRMQSLCFRRDVQKSTTDVIQRRCQNDRHNSDAEAHAGARYFVHCCWSTFRFLRTVSLVGRRDAFSDECPNCKKTPVKKYFMYIY